MKKYNYKKSGLLILGINGWFEYGHDASAALIEVTKEKCEILGALEEEKLSKQKCSYDAYPILSVQALLEMYSIEVSEIDYIVFGWNQPKMYELKGNKFPFNDNKELLKAIFPGVKIKREIPIEFIDHHLAHAACSYRTSTFNESLIAVIDGQGETEATSVWVGEGNDIRKIHKCDIETSFGYLYEATNSVLGFRKHESGKTMGLAPYGQPDYYNEISSCLEFHDGNISLSNNLQDIFNLLDRFEESDFPGEKIIRNWEYYFRNKLKIEKNKSVTNSFYDFDYQHKQLSSSVQKILEDKIIEYIKYYSLKTGQSQICLSGGVALNCILNGKLLQEDFVDDLFINPASNDAGVALGAALELSHQLGYESRVSKQGNFSPFLGTEYSNDEIIKCLNNRNIKYRLFDDSSDFMADVFSNNKTTALFQGRNEWGPRALGNRSIITSPKKHENLDYINQHIKKRETGRPLGPSILVEDADLLLKQPKMLGQYMNVGYSYEGNRDLFPAVIHVDRTFRPGFVDSSFNDTYYNQLSSIKKKVGNSVVINTSFNLDTPIIYHIDDAINYFVNSNLDVLIFNNEIVLTK